MRTQVFISYRRDGGLETAKRLHTLLRDDYEVFFDKESLRSGTFDDKIENAISQCTDFLLVLSGNIFDRFEEDGDWISRELMLALRLEKNLIPIFLPDFHAPDSDNEVIKTAMRYNGIRYAQDDGFTKNLFSFLKSNKKCVLDIACTEQGYKLTDAAVEALKETYQKMVYTKEYAVHIVLAFPDAAESAEKLTPQTDDPRRAEVVDFMCQRLLRRHRNLQAVLELAIEFMTGDIRALATLPLHPAVKNKPLAEAVFHTPTAERYSFYPVAVWVEVIEELFKEITTEDSSRSSHYRRLRNQYTPIDCVINQVSNDIRKQWYFPTFSANSELTYPDQTWYPLMQPSVTSLSPQTLMQFILPDFYFRVAETILYTPSQELKTLLQTPDANIRFLSNYWYGLS